MAQLELGAAPEEKLCAWCGVATLLVYQASPCCTDCKASGPKARTATWLQRVGRSNKR